MTTGLVHFFDSNRFVSAAGGADGATVSFYYTGTTNLAPIYSNSALTIPLSNPVTIATGQVLPQIYLDPTISYRRRTVFVSDGSVHDVDPVIVAAIVSMGPSNIGTSASGVFFDSSDGDTFTGTKFSAPADATLTTGASTIAFSSATAKSLDCVIKDSGGNVLESCFDSIDVDATYTLTSFPSAGIEGFLTGLIQDVAGLGQYGTVIEAGGAGAGFALARIYNANSPMTTGTQFAFGAPITIRVQYRVRGTAVTATVTYPSTADEVQTLTQVFTTSSFETPRLFSKLGVKFCQGAATLTALRVSAPYSNASYAFVGDSLTQGKYASLHANGYAAKIRAAHPDQVIIAGAPSATTANWLAATQPIIDMNPRYVFVALGTNDFTGGRALVDIQADYTTIVSRFTAAGITPIVLAAPPIGNGNVPTFNTWLSTQGWTYVDIYSVLKGTGTSLAAAYDSGDGVHWNDAGHTAVYSTVSSAISSLPVPETTFVVDTDGTMAENSDSNIPSQKAVVTYVAAQRTGTSALGYRDGAGGAVTQITSRTTGVTLNKLCGAVTLVSAAGTTSWQSFTVTNSTVAANDVVLATQKSGTDIYQYAVTNVAAGSFQLSYRTVIGTTVEQPVFNFTVIKSSNA